MNDNDRINVLPYSLGMAAVGAGIGAVNEIAKKPYLYNGMPVGKFHSTIKQAFIDEGDKFIKNDENYNKVTSALKELKNINDKSALEQFIKSGKVGNLPKKTEEIIKELLEKSNITMAKTQIELCLNLDREYSFKKAISLTENKSIDNMIDNYKSYIDKLSKPAKENIDKAKKSMVQNNVLLKAGTLAAIIGGTSAIIFSVINYLQSKKNK